MGAVGDFVGGAISAVGDIFSGGSKSSPAPTQATRGFCRVFVMEIDRLL